MSNGGDAPIETAETLERAAYGAIARDAYREGAALLIRASNLARTPAEATILVSLATSVYAMATHREARRLTPPDPPADPAEGLLD